jgi:hypothetical protein
MMGFLNKFMNAVGVELEQEAINDTAELLSKTGWKPGIHGDNNFKDIKHGIPQRDNLFTYLRVIRHAPGALLWEKKWIKGVPSDYDQAAIYLKKHIGYSFPVLKPIKEGRVIRTLTTILRDNLDQRFTVTGLKIKIYAGYIFSTLVWNDLLKSEIKNLSVQLTPDLNDEIFNQLTQVAKKEIPSNSTTSKDFIIYLQQKLLMTQKEAALVVLALAASYSPAQVNDVIIETILKHVEPAGIVEIIVWLSVLQLLNRMSGYYSLTKSY